MKKPEWTQISLTEVMIWTLLKTDSNDSSQEHS